MAAMAVRAGHLGERGADVLLEAEGEQNDVLAWLHQGKASGGVRQWRKLQAGREQHRGCGCRDAQREDGSFHGLIVAWEPTGVRRHDEGTREQNMKRHHGRFVLVRCCARVQTRIHPNFRSGLVMDVGRFDGTVNSAC